MWFGPHSRAVARTCIAYVVTTFSGIAARLHTAVHMVQLHYFFLSTPWAYNNKNTFTFVYTLIPIYFSISGSLIYCMIVTAQTS